jgi:hypothetical protein
VSSLFATNPLISACHNQIVKAHLPRGRAAGPSEVIFDLEIGVYNAPTSEHHPDFIMHYQ